MEQRFTNNSTKKVGINGSKNWKRNSLRESKIQRETKCQGWRQYSQLSRLRVRKINVGLIGKTGNQRSTKISSKISGYSG